MTPPLVVEVISPITARLDRGRERTIHQSSGVPHWIVDFETRRFERLAPGAGAAELLGSGARAMTIASLAGERHHAAGEG
ncbi:MAG: Uma2 family endonuclease [Gemmatimonadetes bacterium]|nr:Uma2 family endonuclease [Gemmatimonadota bacterium]